MAGGLEYKKETGLVNRQGQGGGCKCRLTLHQDAELQQLLQAQDFWTTAEVVGLIVVCFGIYYSQRQVRNKLKRLHLYFYKPQPQDYRRPDNAAEQLQERLLAVSDAVQLLNWPIAEIAIGFADESCPQANANTARLWSTRPGLKRQVNTSKLAGHSFGFYALQGQSFLSPLSDSKADSFVHMLQQVRQVNQNYPHLILIWDNLPAHKVAVVEQQARQLNIHLLHTPPYSPDLNPIERIWKQIKRSISYTGFIPDKEQLQQIININFLKLTQKLSFAHQWLDNIFKPVWPNLYKCVLN